MDIVSYLLGTKNSSGGGRGIPPYDDANDGDVLMVQETPSSLQGTAIDPLGTYSKIYINCEDAKVCFDKLIEVFGDEAGVDHYLVREPDEPGEGYPHGLWVTLVYETDTEPYWLIQSFSYNEEYPCAAVYVIPEDGYWFDSWGDVDKGFWHRINSEWVEVTGLYELDLKDTLVGTHPEEGIHNAEIKDFISGEPFVDAPVEKFIEWKSVTDPALKNAKETGGIGWTEGGESEEKTLEWDGDTTGKEIVVFSQMSNYMKFCKLSDDVPDIVDLNNKTMSAINLSGEEESYEIVDDFELYEDGKALIVADNYTLEGAIEVDGLIVITTYDGPQIVVVSEENATFSIIDTGTGTTLTATFPHRGLYFGLFPVVSSYITSLTYSYSSVGEVHKINPAYISAESNEGKVLMIKNGVAVWSDIPVPEIIYYGEEAPEEKKLWVKPFPSTFHIEAIEDTTIALEKRGNPAVGICQYAVDNADNFSEYTYGSSINLNAGQRCYFKISKSVYSFTGNDYLRFSSTNKINVGGTISDLIGGKEQGEDIAVIPRDYCFYSLFAHCTNLINANKLILDVDLDGYTRSFKSMFYDCTSLISAPNLPATALTAYCCEYMFYGCTSLISAPELPSTILATRCYGGMFEDCASLITAPELPATTLVGHCYADMFYGCTSLLSAPELPATTTDEYCYNNMFRECTSIKSLPELPATILTTYCYQNMFASCTNIKLSTSKTGNYTKPYRIPTAGTGTAGPGSLSSMFQQTGGTFKSTPSINTTYYLWED